MIRYEFNDDNIHADQIHPLEIFNEEKELAKSFVINYPSSEKIEKCPISLNGRSEIIFEKWGQRYAICPETWSICLADIPNENILSEYFYSSKLAKFRTTLQYQNTVAEQRKDVWFNLIEWIEGRINRYIGNAKYSAIDWGSKSIGWIDMLRNCSVISNLFIKEALPPIKDSYPKDKVDVICMFDVLQRKVNPRQFLLNASTLLKEEGLLLLTCRSGTGFDILTLGQNSDSIFPFDHICLPSPKGIEKLLLECGFEILEITTPGLLDVKYVKRNIDKLSSSQYFERYLITHSMESTLEQFQAFLQRNNLSSHLRVVARKIGEKK